LDRNQSKAMMQGHRLLIAYLIAVFYPFAVYEGVRAYHPFERPQFELRLVASFAPPPATPEEQKALEDKVRAGQKKLEEMLAAAEQAKRDFYRVLILVATPLGVAAMILGSYLKFPAIGTGLVIGGFVSVTNAYWGYWGQLSDRTRHVSIWLGVCLIIFIWYRYQRRREAGA
jgi:hypothetical protein